MHAHPNVGAFIPGRIESQACLSKRGNEMTLKSLIFVPFIALAMLPEAHAVDIFGNGDRGSTAYSTANDFNGQNAWAIPFTPGNSSLADRNLLGAWVLVGGNSEIAVSYEVKIYQDAGTNQGPTGTALASGSLNSLEGSEIGWNFVTFAVPVQLSANGKYYVSVEESTSLGGFAWAEPSAGTYSNLGSGSDYSVTSGGSQNVWFRTGTTWSSSVNPVINQPLGFQLVTVPEPSSYALAGIAAITMGHLARRRKFA